MSVDTALREREAKGQPIRVGMVGAGATGRAISLQLGTPVAGMRLVGIANRTPQHGERAFREAGIERQRHYWVRRPQFPNPGPAPGNDRGGTFLGHSL